MARVRRTGVDELLVLGIPTLFAGDLLLDRRDLCLILVSDNFFIVKQDRSKASLLAAAEAVYYIPSP